MVQRVASEAQLEVSKRYLKETAGTTRKGSSSGRAAAMAEAEARAFRARRGSEADLEVTYCCTLPKPIFSVVCALYQGIACMRNVSLFIDTNCGSKPVLFPSLAKEGEQRLVTVVWLEVGGANHLEVCQAGGWNLNTGLSPLSDAFAKT